MKHMGRWWGCGRRTVEQTRCVDIGTVRRVGKPERNWWVSRDKLFYLNIRPTTWKNGCIHLAHQVLETVSVPSRFGGERFYFRCDCGRRVEKLHSVRGGPWRCRHCYQLTYATRQAVPHHRHIMKAQKIRLQLGGSADMLEGFPPRPKGMHWKRYERLRTRHDAATERYLGMSMAWLRRLRARFSG
jgi:hypothetical protein